MTIINHSTPKTGLMSLMTQKYQTLQGSMRDPAHLAGLSICNLGKPRRLVRLHRPCHLLYSRITASGRYSLKISLKFLTGITAPKLPNVSTSHFIQTSLPPSFTAVAKSKRITYCMHSTILHNSSVILSSSSFSFSTGKLKFFK